MSSILLPVMALMKTGTESVMIPTSIWKLTLEPVLMSTAVPITSWIDDPDGVTNDLDLCANTPAGDKTVIPLVVIRVVQNHVMTIKNILLASLQTRTLRIKTAKPQTPGLARNADLLT